MIMCVRERECVRLCVFKCVYVELCLCAFLCKFFCVFEYVCACGE